MDSSTDDRSAPNSEQTSSPERHGNIPVREFPDQLESPQTKLVYLYLSKVPDAGVHDLRENLHIDLLTLYPVLNTLVERGLVERDGAGYSCSPGSDD